MGNHSNNKMTILVVDDLATMRALVTECLEESGYTVLPAASGKEALETSNGTDAPIDLLLTDIEMDGMNGFSLAGLLLKQRPRMRVLFISGERSQNSFGSIGQPSGQLFLQKPFSPDELRAKVARLLS